jgi:hypothetical protein
VPEFPDLELYLSALSLQSKASLRAASVYS